MENVFNGFLIVILCFFLFGLFGDFAKALFGLFVMFVSIWGFFWIVGALFGLIF